MADVEKKTWFLVLGLLIAGIGGAWAAVQIDDYFDFFGRKKPNLVALPPLAVPGEESAEMDWLDDSGGAIALAEPDPQPHYTPFGPGMPTVVPVENTGEYEAPIRSASFRIVDRITTPSRRLLTAMHEPVYATFLARHFDRQSRTFTLDFQRPPFSPGKHEQTWLDVSIVEPSWSGWTYVGTLTVFYANGRSLKVNNVVLDVLSEVPRR